MTTVPKTSLTVGERAVLEAFTAELDRRLGSKLHAVWLFGSAARGERRSDDSDVDVLVVADHAGWQEANAVRSVLDEVAASIGLADAAWSFSVHVWDFPRLERRRAIRSFFLAEVERDKVAFLERLDEPSLG
jgi:predicted nucleotidyltransferase